MKSPLCRRPWACLFFALSFLLISYSAQAAYQPLGISAQVKTGIVSFLPALGVASAYQLKKDTELELSYMQGGIDATSVVKAKISNALVKETLDFARISSSDLSLRFRQFFSPTFSGYAGLGRRTFAARVAMLDGAYDLSVQGAYTSLLAGIGNRWHWDNGMMVGVDWIGIEQPLFGSTKVERAMSLEGITFNDRAIEEKVHEHAPLVASTKIDSMVAYIGFNF